MSKKHKKVCKTLSCIEHFLVLASITTECVSISAFSSLFDVPVEAGGTAIGLKFSNNYRNWNL